MTPEVIHSKYFAHDAAEFILTQAHRALGERGEFRLALSGGNTPRAVHAELVALGRDLPWERVLITFGDERCVPPEHEQSNFKMARATLLAPLSLPDKNVLRMHGEIEPRLAAQQYQEQLDVMAAQRGEQIYRHDLILLGLGDDGHTASLFPGTAALDEMSDRVVANFVPQLEQWRLTFTYPLLNQARQICFLVGVGKDAWLIERVLGGETEFPAARVQPVDGAVAWIIGE